MIIQMISKRGSIAYLQNLDRKTKNVQLNIFVFYFFARQLASKGGGGGGGMKKTCPCIFTYCYLVPLLYVLFSLSYVTC